MKMNRFRVNLHPAFFKGEKDPDKLDANVEDFTKKDLEALQNDIVNNISQKRQTRIANRSAEAHDTIKDKNNADIWTLNITQGYARLVRALDENHYFDGPNRNRKEELKEIKQQYEDEVLKQYKKIVGKRSKNKFEDADQDLFNQDSPDSPANKIYTKLTGATTISTIDRQYTEGYDIDFLGNEPKTPQTVEGEEEDIETEIETDNRKFLSNDLPEYLWNIRKTPQILNVMKWLPIFSVKTDRPSKVDRDAISDFIKAANKIPTKNGKSPAMVLIDALHDNNLNTDSGIDDYAVILQKHGMDLDGFKKQGTNDVNEKQLRKCISRVMEVGNFYLNTQKANNDIKDQHAIYLSVLGIIEDSKGADNAVNKFKDRVEKAKADKKTEKKEGYKSGDQLTLEFKAFAKKLGITDFTNATRLSKLDKNYFKDTPVEKILANLNNDDVINARDSMAGGLKTGAQFLNIIQQVGKEKALSNLLKHAKLRNDVLKFGLNTSKFTEEEIKGGNKELILLLQDIINKPGEDLYTLLSGESPIEGDAEIMKQAYEHASEILKQMNIDAWNKDEITLPTPESLHSGLAAALYTEYKRGVGLGNRISFDKWIKGLAMNTGFQVRDGGKVVVGIGLDYSRSINLGKGWSTTPELSAGAFIPLGYGRPDVSGSVGFNDEVAKKWITKNGVVNKLGVQGGVTLMPSGVVVISAGPMWSMDKAAGIDSAEQTRRIEFKDKIISPILENIYNERKLIKTLDATKLKFNDTNLIETIKRSISEVANSKDEKGKVLVPEKDQQLVTDAVMRLLLNYENEDLSDKNVREVIALKIADQYAMAWAEARKAHITEKAYLSGVNLGAFWVLGSPSAGVYAGVTITKHDLDGYGDRKGKNNYTVDNSEITKEKGVRDTKSLESLNARLGLAEGEGLVFSKNGDQILVPNSMLSRIKVSESMKKLLVRDTNGNVSISPWTTMRESIVAGTATQSRELLIGESKDKDGKDLKFVPLDTVKADWFVTDIAAVNKNILKEENEYFYSPDGIKSYFEQFKVKNKALQNYNPTDEDFKKVSDGLKELNKGKEDKKAKVFIIGGNGEFTMDAGERGEDEESGKGIEFELRTKLDMLDPNAKTVADSVYAKALKLKNPKVLNAVKHNASWGKDYAPFRKAMENKNYEDAKTAIEPIFKRLDDEIKDENISFSNILEMEEFKGLQGDSLAQAMMSINNIFARSKQVRGGGENYEFKRPYGTPKEMRAIIGERYNILDTLQGNKDINAQAKGRYKELFDATKKYVDDPKNGYAIKSAQAAQLGNTVGFNLGDRTNPENPLFNPEIYDPMVDLNQLDKEIFTNSAREGLHKRAMKMFAENPALVKPALNQLGINTSNLSEADLKNAVEKGTLGVTTDNKCQLTLDIGGKKVTITSGMKFGFFTQCVNHTIILDEIVAESEDGKIEFSSGIWETGEVKETNQGYSVSSLSVGLSVSGTVSGKNGQGGGGETGQIGQEETKHNYTGGADTGDGGGNGGRVRK